METINEICEAFNSGVYDALSLFFYAIPIIIATAILVWLGSAVGGIGASIYEAIKEIRGGAGNGKEE